MGQHWKADDVLHEKSGELVIAGGDGAGQAESFDSSSSLMVEGDGDEAESSLVVADPRAKPSSLAEHQEDVLSPLLSNLSVRTGLSQYYKEQSNSFTNLPLVKSLEEVRKKTTTYNTRMKASRGQASAGPGARRSSILWHLPGPCSNIITKKKAMPKHSSSAQSAAGNKIPPPYKGKKEYTS